MKNILGIAENQPNTINHAGKTWKVVDRRMKANFACVGQDEQRNPKTRFVRTKWVKPKDLVKENEKLKAEYDEVETTWAWDITSLFREVIGKDGREKDVEEYTLQRQLKDGKWDAVNPIDIEKELNDTQKETLKAKMKKTATKLGWKMYAIGIGIVALLVLVSTELYVLLRKG